MRKTIAVLGSLSSLILATTAYAQINVGINPPTSGIDPTTPIGTILSNALTIIFVLAALAVLFMLIIGGFQWIMSGGDKEAYTKARNRITHALIGLAILALSFLIVVVVGQVLSINILSLRSLPTLGQKCRAGFQFDPTTGTCNTPIPPSVTPVPQALP